MVEWKKLGEVCEILDSQRKPVAKEERSQGIYPYYGANGIQDYVSSYIFDGTFLLMGEDGSVINKDKSPVLHWTEGRIWVNNHAHILKENERALLRYLYYSLQCTDVSDIVRGVPPKINQANMRNIPIPIPSLSEQSRIVSILDTFTSSISNLKQQIEERRKQYNFLLDKLYYANKSELLEATERGEVCVKTLDEIGTFTRGRRFVRTDIVEEGVPCIHYGDMYTYYGVCAEKTPTFLTKEKAEKLRFAKKGDVVIVAAGENDIDIGVGVAWLGEEDVVVHDACFIFKHNMNPKYLSYFMRSMNYHLQIRMGVVDGKICSISAKELGRTLAPVPSLQAQSRIVSILDTFEQSISNLEEQLAMREKQYEYYRNQLLTFEGEEERGKT